jgi:hypothetical protein
MDDRQTSLHESLVKFIMKHKQQIQSTIKEMAVSGAQQYHLLLEKNREPHADWNIAF